MNKAPEQRPFLKDVDHWFFGRGSAVTIGIFRIIIGFLALLNFLMILPFFDDWFTERGYVPLSMMRRWLPPVDRHFTWFGHVYKLPFDVPRFTLLGNVTDSRITFAFYLLAILAALLTMVGFWSRLSSIVLAVCVVSLQHRNPIILHGGDSVLRISVLYLALAPSGAACSFDRLIGLWKGRLAAGPALVSLWPQRLVQVNMALIYFTTVWLKWGGHLWRNGTATWYPARLGEFERFWYPPFMRNMPAVYIGTYGTLIVELSLATLVFAKPFRRWVLLAGLVMHGYIDYTMNIPLFSFLMVSLYVSFYSGEEISDWGKRVGTRLSRFRTTVQLPKSFGQGGASRSIAAADFLGIIEIEPSEDGTAHGLGKFGARYPWLFLFLLPGIRQKLIRRVGEQDA